MIINSSEWILNNRTLVTVVLGVLVGLYIVKYFAVGYLKALSRRTKNSVDNLAVDVVRSIGWWFVLGLALFIGTRGLEAAWVPGVDIFFIITATYQVTRMVKAIFAWGQRRLVSGGGTPIIRGFVTILDIVVWSFGILAIFAALGYNVSTFVAGLGIGGLAIALALKSLLSDIFSSLSIYFDKPFRVGDYIQKGSHEGVVEEIGLKTTRVRSPRGEQIIMANTDLTSAVVQNFGRLTSRRIVEKVELPFETQTQVVDELIQKTKLAFEAIEKAEFSRFYVRSVTSGHLELELVYFVESKQHDAYKEVQHVVNLALRDALIQCNLA